MVCDKSVSLCGVGETGSLLLGYVVQLCDWTCRVYRVSGLLRSSLLQEPAGDTGPFGVSGLAVDISPIRALEILDLQGQRDWLEIPDLVPVGTTAGWI